MRIKIFKIILLIKLILIFFLCFANLYYILTVELSKVNIDENLEAEFIQLVSNKPIIDINLSLEQKMIIQQAYSSNIIIDAIAGSGKTSTILHLALEYPNLNMIQITYNNMLKKEVRKKANKLSISNMSIHTYHSLAVNYYNKLAFTDDEIKKILINNKSLIMQSQIPVDVLMIDEVQDMTFDYLSLVKKFIFDTKSNPRIILFGDYHQAIYNFKGSNAKFLTLGNKIFNSSLTFNTVWNKLTLSTSYRLTNQISWFINNIVLRTNRILTNKIGPVVDYYIANPYNIYKKIGKQIIKLIKNNDIKEDDIFILSPSIKSIDPPYKKLENYLVKHGLLCLSSTNDDAKLDDGIIANKIVFTTYHQAKGRERKMVILYNFDESYMQFYFKSQCSNQVEIAELETRSNCPDILYVGLTRASEKLILIQDNRYPPLNFLDIQNLKSGPNLKIIVEDEQNILNINMFKDKTKIQQIKKTTVTDLIKFIDSRIADQIIQIFNKYPLFTTICEPNNWVNIPNKIKIIQKNKGKEVESWEDVSDLNGLVIPAIYEKILLKKSTIEEYVLAHIDDDRHSDIKKYAKNIKMLKYSNPDAFLKIGNIYLALENNLHARIVQIKSRSYNWLSLNMVLQTHSNMKFLSNVNMKFEIKLITLKNGEIIDGFIIEHDVYGSICINGRIDALDDQSPILSNNSTKYGSLWEFKCVDHLTFEHKLQLILYYWIWISSSMNTIYGSKDFFLLNIKSGQTLQLNIIYHEQIKQIIELLFENKYSPKQTISDDEFIKICNK